MIEVDQLTLQYPGGKGIYDISFTVGKGEVLGYLGPNGAGKTTTIRCLLGFSVGNQGECRISGLDCRKDAPKIQEFLGYIPGEIAFLNGMSGMQFLNFMAEMRGTKDKTRMHELIEQFEINPSGKIKKYSKGMKQKIGIIAALMHDPQVIILDEPTSGLDPLMQNRFVELIGEEKKKGKTILMSSHMFEEVEKTCDRVAIIKDGRLARVSDVNLLRQSQRKSYLLQPAEEKDLLLLQRFGAELGQVHDGIYEVFVKGEQVDAFIKLLSQMHVLSLESKKQSLEEVFLNLYGRGEENNEVGTV